MKTLLTALVLALFAPSAPSQTFTWRNLTLYSSFDLFGWGNDPVLIVTDSPPRGYQRPWGRIYSWAGMSYPAIDRLEVIGIAAWDSRDCAIGAVAYLTQNDLPVSQIQMTSSLSYQFTLSGSLGWVTADPSHAFQSDLFFTYCDPACSWQGCGFPLDAPDIMAVMLKVVLR